MRYRRMRKEEGEKKKPGQEMIKKGGYTVMSKDEGESTEEGKRARAHGTSCF